MSLEALLRPEARHELAAASEWYEARKAGLGGDFLDEFLAAIGRIEDHPKSCPVIDRDIRRALLRRFPYALYYLVEETHIEVLGVLHCHQHKDQWRKHT